MTIFVRCKSCRTTYPVHFEHCPRCAEVTPQVEEKKK